MNKEIQFLIYNTPQGNVSVNVAYRRRDSLAYSKAMAALFGVQVPAISKHLKNIFDEGELEERLVVSKMETTVNRVYRGVLTYVFNTCILYLE